MKQKPQGMSKALWKARKAGLDCEQDLLAAIWNSLEWIRAFLAIAVIALGAIVGSLIRPL